MKKKKGFTLIELLAVIVLLGLLTTIAVPNIIKSNKKIKTNLYCNKVKIIEKAAEQAKKTIDLNSTCEVDGIEYNCSSVLISELITNGYLEADENGASIDPRDKSSMNDEEILVYEKNNRIYAKIDNNVCSAETITMLNPGELSSRYHTLTLDTVNGNYNGSTTIILKEGRTTTLSEPTKDGYELVSWTGGGSQLVGNTFTMGTSDVTLTADWEFTGYILTIITDGGIWNGITPQIKNENDTVTINESTKSEYIFTGWRRSDNNELITTTTFIMPNNSLTLTAVWELFKYELTVNTDGGVWDGSTSILLVSEESFKIKETVKSGYVFNGWTVSGEGSTFDNETSTFTMGNSNSAITANWLAFEDMFTYSGNYVLVDEENGNWKIKFKSNGTLIFNIDLLADVFLVGGGGGGGSGAGGGGGGGYTLTKNQVNIVALNPYSIVIGGGGGGGGGDGAGSTGGISSAFGYSANGGIGGRGFSGYGGTQPGGSGGSGGGAGVNGGAGGTGGTNGASSSGAGQRTTTREFGEEDGDLYAGGGGGGNNAAGGSGGGARGGNYTTGNSAGANTGGGGGGSGSGAAYGGGSGGSGIVIIRKAS